MRVMTLPLGLCILLATALGLAVWQRHSATRGRITFVLLCFAVCLTAFGELLTFRGVVSEQIGDRIKYAGLLPLAPLWLGFTTQLAGLEVGRRVPWFPAMLLTPAACVYPLMWSTAYGGLFWTPVPDGEDLHGPLWMVLTFYEHTLFAVGSALLAAAGLRSLDPRRAILSLLVAIVPLVGLVASALHVNGQVSWPYDLTPVLLGLVLLAVRGALLGGGLLDPLPFPQRELLRQIPLGLVLTDRGGAVALINGAAAEVLGVETGDALGRDVESLLAGRSPVAMEDQVLQRRGRSAGRLLVFG
jgi:PAS domain-containing protein